MDVKVKYNGDRADKLKEYNLPKFVGGPYDFSKESCMMDKEDAELLLTRNPSPKAFEIIREQVYKRSQPQPTKEVLKASEKKAPPKLVKDKI